MEVSGQLSVAQFMRMCLLHPTFGYYMKKDVFGNKGDFTTNPEISQMFGELIAIWFVQHHLQTRHDKQIQLVELGPGRGTLMLDILRSLKQFPSIYEKISKVILVDQSLFLRKIQKKTLEKYADLQIEWYDRIQDIPLDFSYYVAHEFYDALPCYQFKKTEDGFKEIMIDIEEEEQVADFRPVISHHKTKSMLLLEKQKFYKDCAVGDIIQICPDSWDITCWLATRIKEYGGAALIADYGRENIRTDTFRGIKNHQFVSPYTDPGELDLSFDVEFSSIKNAAELNGNGLLI